MSTFDMIALAILFGVLLTVSVSWWAFNFVWNHVRHCNICKQRFLDDLNEHHDTGTRCFWKQIIQSERKTQKGDGG